MITIATFYRFAAFDDYASWRDPLMEKMRALNVFGTILLSPEGLNATISGSKTNVLNVISQLESDKRFADLDVKYAHEDSVPFHKPKVKLKDSIITLQDITTPQAACVSGKQCSPSEWDALIDDPSVTILDTRNEYETYLGTFRNAQLWPMRRFSEIVEKVDSSFNKTQKIAMFCTGGVRCEKLSSWMIQNGYENLYQLEGGIIRYLEKTPEKGSNWQGSCYVFDERIAVTHGNVTDKSITLCPSCDHPLNAADRCHAAYLPATQCGFCA